MPSGQDTWYYFIPLPKTLVFAVIMGSTTVGDYTLDGIQDFIIYSPGVGLAVVRVGFRQRLS